MTSYELAKKECANFQAGGECLEGFGKCLLSEKPVKPCRYFETHLLHIGDQPDSVGGRIDGAKRAGWLQARELYPFALAKDIKRAAKVRSCPDCGGALAKRQRTCEKCQKKRRTESYRQYRQSLKVS